jgi:hypothetical protein
MEGRSNASAKSGDTLQCQLSPLSMVYIGTAYGFPGERIRWEWARRIARPSMRCDAVHSEFEVLIECWLGLLLRFKLRT